MKGRLVAAMFVAAFLLPLVYVTSVAGSPTSPTRPATNVARSPTSPTRPATNVAGSQEESIKRSKTDVAGSQEESIKRSKTDVATSVTSRSCRLQKSHSSASDSSESDFQKFMSPESGSAEVDRSDTLLERFLQSAHPRTTAAGADEVSSGAEVRRASSNVETARLKKLLESDEDWQKAKLKLDELFYWHEDNASPISYWISSMEARGFDKIFNDHKYKDIPVQKRFDMGEEVNQSIHAFYENKKKKNWFEKNLLRKSESDKVTTAFDNILKIYWLLFETKLNPQIVAGRDWYSQILALESGAPRILELSFIIRNKVNVIMNPPKSGEYEIVSSLIHEAASELVQDVEAKLKILIMKQYRDFAFAKKIHNEEWDEDWVMCHKDIAALLTGRELKKGLLDFAKKILEGKRRNLRHNTEEWDEGLLDFAKKIHNGKGRNRRHNTGAKSKWNKPTTEHIVRVFTLLAGRELKEAKELLVHAALKTNFPEEYKKKKASSSKSHLKQSMEETWKLGELDATAFVSIEDLRKTTFDALADAIAKAAKEYEKQLQQAITKSHSIYGKYEKNCDEKNLKKFALAKSTSLDLFGKQIDAIDKAANVILDDVEAKLNQKLDDDVDQKPERKGFSEEESAERAAELQAAKELTNRVKNLAVGIAMKKICPEELRNYWNKGHRSEIVDFFERSLAKPPPVSEHVPFTVGVQHVTHS